MTPATSALIDAIQRGALADIAGDDPDIAHLDRVVRTCRRIAVTVTEAQRAAVAALAAAGIAATAIDVPPAMQRHEFAVGITRRDGAAAAAVLVDELGYRRHPVWRRGAERSFWATSHEVALTRSDEATVVARLRWGAPARRRWSTRMFRPTAADWATIELPTWAGPGYRLVRPLRLAAERVGRPHDHAALEPFLATPTSLVEPLLDVAEVTAADVVADIGCGDGRLVVTAARRHGCRAIGYEYDADLVTAARGRAREEGVAHLVEIVHGDGLEGPLDGVTVAMLFVPMVVAARAVPRLLERLPGEARIVLHEQSRLGATVPPPDHSEPIVTDDAVTVAHRWRVQGPPAPR